MILWSIQSMPAWDELQATGVLRGRADRVVPEWVHAYAWMIGQMARRIGESPVHDQRQLLFTIDDNYKLTFARPVARYGFSLKKENLWRYVGCVLSSTTERSGGEVASRFAEGTHALTCRGACQRVLGRVQRPFQQTG